MTNPEKIPLGVTPLRTIKVVAREETFRIVQLQGNLFVCSKAHGNCCCGWTSKGRAEVNIALYEQEWERRRIRNKVHLTFSGCLGPCATGNNALLVLGGRSIWFKDMNDDKYIPLIFDYIETLLKDPMARPTVELAEHIFERYLPLPASSPVTHNGLNFGPGSLTPAPEPVPTATDLAELERIDPVCLMEVDPATARWRSEYNGYTFYFCAPACKKSFDKEPQAYL